MNFTLDTKERLVLLAVLPLQGELTTMRTVRDIRQLLEFNESEQSALKFEQSSEGTKWNASAEVKRDFDITPLMSRLILDSFSKLDKEGKIELVHIAVYDRFLDGK